MQHAMQQVDVVMAVMGNLGKTGNLLLLLIGLDFVDTFVELS